MIKQFGSLLLLVAVGCSSQPPTPSNTTLRTDGSPAKPAETSTTESDDMPESAKPAVAAEPETPFQLEDGFTLLGFSDFEAFGAEATTWEGTADGIKCSGKPRGYLYSKQPYENFRWKLDYRFPRPDNLKDEAKFKGNTGFMVYITGDHKVWPISLEVQGKFVQMAAIKENGGAQPVTATDDDAARQKARRPVGQWNAIEIVSKGGTLSVTLNGTPISTCEPDFLSEGAIGIQAEDHPFEVRRMRIRRD